MSVPEDRIDEAIAAHRQDLGQTGIVTGWITITGVVDNNGDGDTSGIAIVYSGGNMAWPAALGLIEAARIQMHAEYGRVE